MRILNLLKSSINKLIKVQGQQTQFDQKILYFYPQIFQTYLTTNTQTSTT